MPIHHQFLDHLHIPVAQAIAGATAFVQEGHSYRMIHPQLSSHDETVTTVVTRATEDQHLGWFCMTFSDSLGDGTPSVLHEF